MIFRLLLLVLVPVLALCLVGCGEGKEAYDSSGQTDDDATRVTWQDVRDGSVKRTNPETGVTWEILGIRTDEADHSKAKQNAENALSAHPDMAGMVGLWAYNPPKMLQAVEDRGMVGKVQIVGFDEDPATIDAIASGKIVGTVVQNPYEFGFRSVQYLSATIRDQEVPLPDDRLIYIPTRLITRENVADFSSEIAQIRAGNGPTPTFNANNYNTSERVSMHFVANLFDPFWLLAEQGCKLGADKFNADVTFYIPPNGQVSEQKRHAESMIVDGVDGLAISVREPAGQVQMINQWCKEMKVITVDADAPGSDRLYYIGTDNLAAGRQAGELLAKACPEGGKVMIFVGSLSAANSKERAQGVIDALLGQ